MKGRGVVSTLAVLGSHGRRRDLAQGVVACFPHVLIERAWVAFLRLRAERLCCTGMLPLSIRDRICDCKRILISRS
jgi:hypothetical protein